MEIDALKKVAAAVPVTPAVQSKPSETGAETVQAKDMVVKPVVEPGAAAAKKPSANTRQEEEASASMLQAAIKTANKQLVQANRQLQASVHERTQRIMVKVIDTETEEVVREIPPEKTMDLFAKVLEMAGILLDEKK